MNDNKFNIELLKAHWISETEPQIDLCAHGQLKVIIGDEIVVQSNENNGWTISATALLLSRM